MSVEKHFIAGNWVQGSGVPFSALDPATQQPVWTGQAAANDHISLAVDAARSAAEQWANLSFDERAGYLKAFGEQVKKHRNDLIEAICRSTGKPRWESATEVDAIFGKIALTIEAHGERRRETSH